METGGRLWWGQWPLATILCPIHPLLIQGLAITAGTVLPFAVWYGRDERGDFKKEFLGVMVFIHKMWYTKDS